jgi:uncharacterized protein (DUF1330 family)
MRNSHKVGAGLVVSFALGVCAADLLYAQAKAPGYIFVEIDVKDKDAYSKEFLPKAQANIKEFGGKYLAGGFNKAISLSGSPPPSRVVLLQFPDIDAVKAFEVKESKLEADFGSQFAAFRAVAIEGVEPK